MSRFGTLLRTRRGGVALMFALAAIPVTGAVGLAIDYGFWNQARSQLAAAADAAVVNTVKIAGTQYAAGDSNWYNEGVAAGSQWFEAQLGSLSDATLAAGSPTVTLTRNGLTFTATVSYNAATNTFFARLFNILTLPLAGTSSSTLTTAPYNEILLALDNSSSMLIGASPADQQQIEELTPCDPSASNSGQSYTSLSYTCVGYTGQNCPVVAHSPYPLSGKTFADPAAGGTAPRCTNLPKVNGQYPLAQAPCAFACHWDANSNDYYGAVRRWNATGMVSIQLRFDVVQSATANVLSTLQQYDLPGIYNITVGVSTFNTDLTQIYPASGGEATADLADAPAAVRAIAANVVSGASGNTGNTDFIQSMTTLSKIATPSGDGTAADKPKKSLILITDGMQDTPGSGRYWGGIPLSACTLLKDPPYNYTIYVLYTPYYSLTNGWYVQNVKSYVEGSTPSQLQSAMQNCASDPVNDFYVASDSAGIQAALAAFLKAATRTAVRFTQ